MAVIDRRETPGQMDYRGELLLPFLAVCEAVNDGWGCSWREGFTTAEAAAWAIDHHEHFKTYQVSRYNYMSIAERYWVELDAVVDVIHNLAGYSPNDQEKARAVGRATGLAFAIVHACQPYYADEKAVSREANKRWQIRHGEREWEPTPGFKYDPPIPGQPRRPVSGPDDVIAVDQARPRGAARRASNQPDLAQQAKKLKPSEITSIKQGVGAGMFKAEDLAKVYGVSTAVIEWVVSS